MFGVAGAGLFVSAWYVMDRERGLLRLKQVMPVPPGAMLLAGMAMAMLFTAVISLVLGVLAASFAGVSLSSLQWMLLLLVTCSA